MTKEIEDEEPTNEELDNMVIKSGARDEDEFQDKVLKNWNITKCCICGKKLNLSNAIEIEDGLAHKYCLWENLDA